MTFLFGLLSVIISWVISMAMFKIVTMCFGLSFDWLIASGIWLSLVYLKWFFNIRNKGDD